MSNTNLNPFGGEAKSTFDMIVKGAKAGLKLSREIAARRTYTAVAAELGEDVAQMAAEAVRAGNRPDAIIARARKAKGARDEREKLLNTPPPIFGSARWAQPDELRPLLKGREAFDHPSSILLGAHEGDGTTPPQFVHWEGDGHLLTLAPTRTGKALTTIVPNLLRYRGSAVVFDPKGELYAMTSKWRRENVGPVYRLAPFDDGNNPATQGFLRHRYNPLAHIRSAKEARELAQLLFPRDPRGVEFFVEDAVAFVTAVILYVLEAAPPERKTLAEVRRFVSGPEDELRRMIGDMRGSRHELVAEAANVVLGKSRDRGFPSLRDTLNTKFSMWGASDIVDSVSGSDFDFADLKQSPATVYIELPFESVEPFAPWVRVVLKSALDAMLHSGPKRGADVLFVLDEFLALGPFEEFRNAIRTHAGAGVKLWFFLQDLGTLEQYYPNGGWRPFMNCAVKQYFGVNDYATAEMLSKVLGTRTVGYVSQSEGGSASSHGSDWTRDGQGANIGVTHGESVHYASRPLLTPDEVRELLGGWTGDGIRRSIVDLNSHRPFQAMLSVYERSSTCRARVGAAMEA